MAGYREEAIPFITYNSETKSKILITKKEFKSSIKLFSTELIIFIYYFELKNTS